MIQQEEKIPENEAKSTFNRPFIQRKEISTKLVKLQWHQPKEHSRKSFHKE